MYRLTDMTLTPPKHQRGITLIESLVAIAVAALGILGILGVQMRTLSDTSTTVRRAQAIRLIEDLSERMRVHPNALGSIADYTANTGSLPTAQASPQCNASPCTHAQFAAYDLREWKRSVERALPQGEAVVFFAPGDNTAGSRRQLGVLIRWRENERDPVSGDTAYKNVLSTTDGTLGGTAAEDAFCTGFTCHMQYIPVASRCAPYFADVTVQYFCPGPKT